MSFDKTPTTWIASWSEDGTTISVPIASFSELTAAEADASTGDIRKIMFAILEQIWDVYNALPTADRPLKMVIQKSATVNTQYNKITSKYIFTIETDIGTQEVRAESSSSPSASASSSPSASASSSPSSSPSASASSSPSSSASSSPSAT